VRLKLSHRVSPPGEPHWSKAWSKQGRRCADEVHPSRRQAAPRMTCQQCCVSRCTLAQYRCSTSFFVAWSFLFQFFRTVTEHHQILSLQFIKLATGWTIFSPAEYCHSTWREGLPTPGIRLQSKSLRHLHSRRTSIARTQNQDSPIYITYSIPYAQSKARCSCI
jgi:hypothetical protein